MPREAADADWFRDPGGQNERTSLAWQRTALSIAAGAAVVSRLTISNIGAWAIIVFALSVAMSVVTFLSARWEYRRRAQLQAPPVLVYEGARAGLLVANVLLLGVTEVVAIHLG